MEEDRSEVNLTDGAVKQPKRRFVGKRAAAEAHDGQPKAANGIESSVAVQGM